MKMLKKVMINLLVVVGVLLILSPFIQDRIVSHLTNQQLELASAADWEQNLGAEVDFDFSIVESIGFLDVLSAWDSHLPIIGEIKIPAVNIHLPIIKGITNEAISVGASTMTPNQVMGQGNYSLVSHRMNNPDLLFTPLERVEIGDVVYLRGIENVYAYTIITIKIIEPEQVEVLEEQEGKVLLTLITCTPDGSQRLMVQGELTEVTEI